MAVAGPLRPRHRACENRPHVVAEVHQRTTEVYDQLLLAQRALLAHLNKAPGDPADPRCRPQPGVHGGRLRALLTELLDTEEHRDEIGLEVLRLRCQPLSQPATEPEDIPVRRTLVAGKPNSGEESLMPPDYGNNIPDELLDAARWTAAPQLTPHHLRQRFAPPR